MEEKKTYKVGSTIGIRLGSQDEDIVEWSNVQTVPTISIKEAIRFFKEHHGLKDVSEQKEEVYPSQQEMEQAFMEYMLKHNTRDVHITELYDQIQQRFNISTEARNRISSVSGNCIFENKVRWTRQSCLGKGYIQAAGKRGFIRITDIGEMAAQGVNITDAAKAYYIREQMNKNHI